MRERRQEERSEGLMEGRRDGVKERSKERKEGKINIRNYTKKEKNIHEKIGLERKQKG